MDATLTIPRRRVPARALQVVAGLAVAAALAGTTVVVARSDDDAARAPQVGAEQSASDPAPVRDPLMRLAPRSESATIADPLMRLAPAESETTRLADPLARLADR